MVQSESLECVWSQRYQQTQLQVFFDSTFPITAHPKQLCQTPQPFLIHLIKPSHLRTIDVYNCNNLPILKRRALCTRSDSPPHPAPKSAPQSRFYCPHRRLYARGIDARPGPSLSSSEQQRHHIHRGRKRCFGMLDVRGRARGWGWRAVSGSECRNLPSSHRARAVGGICRRAKGGRNCWLDC